MSSPSFPPVPALFMDSPLREVRLPYPEREISLLLLADPMALTREEDPASASEEKAETKTEVYWGDLWPAALALAQALLDGTVWLPNGSEDILELGSGSGLVSMCGAMAGKGEAHFLATDYVERSLKLVQANAERNGVRPFVKTQRIDWRDPYPQRHRLILGADVLYDPDADWQVCRFLKQALLDEPHSDARAVIVDPDRWSARNFHYTAQEAGFNVRQFRRPVPFTSIHGPVRVEPLSGPASDHERKGDQTIEAIFYELTWREF